MGRTLTISIPFKEYREEAVAFLATGRTTRLGVIVPHDLHEVAALMVDSLRAPTVQHLTWGDRRVPRGACTGH